MTQPFLEWLFLVIFASVVIKEILNEIKQRKIDWVKLGMLLLFAYVIYKIQFG